MVDRYVAVLCGRWVREVLRVWLVQRCDGGRRMGARLTAAVHLRARCTQLRIDTAQSRAQLVRIKRCRRVVRGVFGRFCFERLSIFRKEAHDVNVPPLFPNKLQNHIKKQTSSAIAMRSTSSDFLPERARFRSTSTLRSSGMRIWFSFSRIPRNRLMAATSYGWVSLRIG